MQINAHFRPFSEFHADWLVAAVFEDGPLPATTAALDAALNGAIGRLRESGDITGKVNELVPLLQVHGIAATRVLVVGLGRRDQVDRGTLVAAGAAAARLVTTKQVQRLAMVLPEAFAGQSVENIALGLGVGLIRGSQSPGLRKSKPDRFVPHEFCLLAPPTAPVGEVERAVHRAGVEGSAVALVQELVNTPPCDLYPETFAQRADEVAKIAGLQFAVLDPRQMEAEGMGSLLGVARGSVRPARFVILRHRGGGSRTLGLVGKGVTFDSGGLSLKTNEQMLDMKCDMAGAATVLGAMQAIASLRIPVNVDGYLPLVENMPGGNAFKLGDVLRARNGKTIEIHNTDAEGRLILADALAYAVHEKVDHLVDLATLTGACMVALGTDVAGAMSNSDVWLQRLLGAAGRAGEKAWALPMYPHFAEMIKSKVADIKNTGGSRYGGAITAAKFLEEFVGQTPWVHLDIAGPAWVEHENASRDAGGSGCFVSTLIELAFDYVN